ncbi:nuclear transport factor 2 family protein [Nocardia sp. NPDC004711]
MSDADRTRQLYVDLQQFYAAHLRLLDDGRVDEWAAEFEPAGLLIHPQRAATHTGRAEIADGLRRTAQRLRAAGLVRRHWLGNLTIENDGAATGIIRTRFYSLVVEAGPGQSPRLHLSTDIRDHLVPHGTSWLVRERSITHDPILTTPN